MVKKIALFAVWMAVLSVLVYKMAYADCGSCEKKGAGAVCEMKDDKDCAMKSEKVATKFNFVPGNRKA